MQRAGLWAVIALLLVNSAGTVWLLASRGSMGTSGLANLTDTQLAQMDKLFRILSDFHQELETVTGQATYADDKEKADGKEALKTESLAFGLSRLEYETARKTRSARDFQAFLEGALYPREGQFGRGSLDAPEFKRFVAAKYDANFRQIADSSWINYGNVSKLESLKDEFKVLAQSLVEDLK